MMLRQVKTGDKSTLMHLSIKQREMLFQYRADATRREWPTLQEMLNMPPPAPPNSPSNSAAPRVRGEWA